VKITQNVVHGFAKLEAMRLFGSELPFGALNKELIPIDARTFIKKQSDTHR
jgi:hypothetical protein